MTWRERVIHARAYGRFSALEVSMASHWQRCAVGEQAQAHPLVVKLQPRTSMPLDEGLLVLGGRFATAVDQDDFDRADRLLDRIDDRVLTLKRCLH